MILDCHTHHAAPQPEAVISLAPADLHLAAGMPAQLFSAGVHPWHAAEASEETFAEVERLAALPNVVAVGEAGIDTLRGAPMFQQMLAFRRQVEISERARKPLIVHNVRAHQQIIQLRRDLGAVQPWVIHGFRGRPEVADMLLRASADIVISFGPQFNPAALRAVPAGRRLAETDDADATPRQVVEALSAAAGAQLRHEFEATAHRIFPCEND